MQLLFPVFCCREKTSQTYRDRTHVGDLIDLYLGVDAARAFQNGADLVSCYSVHPAAKGYQLNKVDVFILRKACYIPCRRIQPCVVGPLVAHVDGKGPDPVRKAVLRYYHCSKSADKSIDAVIYLRIHMIGPSGKHHNRKVLLFRRFKVFHRFSPDVLKILFVG